MKSHAKPGPRKPPSWSPLLKANSGKGLSRHFVAKRLGISPHYLRRLIEEHGIDFPLYGDRP